MSRRLRCLVFATTLFMGLGVGGWLVRDVVLQKAANLWAISDEVSSADVAVVLGGGLYSRRPQAAAELFKRGLVKKILISNVAEEPINGVASHTELNRAVLLELGVPPSAIEIFGNANKNTVDEAHALKAWAERNRIAAAIIPADIFFARRVRWIMHRVFSGSSIGINVVSVKSSYSCKDWWRTKEGRNAFVKECLKYAYYRLFY